MSIFSDIVNGIAGFITPQSKTSCACCKKCKKIFRSPDYKRVFVCQDEYYTQNIGMPILATKVDEIINCYPPCMIAGMYDSFDPYNADVPAEPNPEVYDYENDWDPHSNETQSDMSNEYYQP